MVECLWRLVPIPPSPIPTCCFHHGGVESISPPLESDLTLELALTKSTEEVYGSGAWDLSGLVACFHSLRTQLKGGPANPTEQPVIGMKPFWILQAQRRFPSQYHMEQGWASPTKTTVHNYATEENEDALWTDRVQNILLSLKSKVQKRGREDRVSHLWCFYLHGKHWKNT